MDLHHQFEVDAAVEQVWPAFLDMPRVAPCMPGAEVTAVIDERNVEGAAKVKVGPVNLRFDGQAEMTEIDNGEYSALMVAKGSDTKGRGRAEAGVRFSLTEARDHATLVTVHTTLNLTGSVAQYGRASGLIDGIADQLITEFVANLEAELAGSDEPGPSEPGPDQPPEAEAVSGLTLLFRSISAIVKRWFRGS